MPYDEKNLTLSGVTAFFGGHPFGWTRDAAVIGFDLENLVIDDIQQIAGVVDVRRTKVGITIKLNLAENTLENLKIAWGINANITRDDTTQKRTLLGDFTGSLPEGELIIDGKGPNGVARTFTFYKAKVVEVGDLEQDARNYTVISITIQVVRDPDHSELFKITEEFIPSSTVSE